MKALPTSRQTPMVANLRRLFYLRLIEILGQLLAIIVAGQTLEVALPYRPLLITIGLLTLFNVFTWLRISKPWPITDYELFSQILIDVIALTVLLYYTGGSTNPFVSLYLLPLTIAATLLPWGYTMVIALLTIGSYSLLMGYYVPLSAGGPGAESAVTGHAHHNMTAAGEGNNFSLHIWGMWLNFVVSAVLIAYFVVRMADSIRQRDRQLAHAREETLRNEQLIALGTLATGAAHELGTPLSTIAVIAKDLQHECEGKEELGENLQILREQVGVCKDILSRLLANAGQSRAEESARVPVEQFLHELLDKWQIMRPRVRLVSELSGGGENIIADQTLMQALLNLLNNAADVSPEDVTLKAHWDHEKMVIEILDRGPGLSAEAQKNAGKAFFTTKPSGQGLGLGLFLANATIERFGGSVRMYNREDHGARVEVILPLTGKVTDQ